MTPFLHSLLGWCDQEVVDAAAVLDVIQKDTFHNVTITSCQIVSSVMNQFEDETVCSLPSIDTVASAPSKLSVRSGAVFPR